MVESKFVVLQMIPHTLFIEWDFEHYSLVVLLFMELFTSRCEVFSYILFTYTVLFIYTILFIRPVFSFKCSFLDLFIQFFPSHIQFFPKPMFSKDM